MPAINYDILIGENGTYWFPPHPPSKQTATLQVEGTFDGCTVTLGYMAKNGTTFIPFRRENGDAYAFTSDDGISVDIPAGRILAAQVTDEGASTALVFRSAAR
jgi:hypothetical protein